MKTPSRDFVLAMLLIGALFVGFLYSGMSSSAGNWSHTRAGREQMNLTEIGNAIRNYQTELNSELPVSPELFFAALCGKNPKGIAFLGPAKFQDSKSGIRCDAWRRPYQVFRGADGWLIRSAGPDHLFNDNVGKGSDDMTVFISIVENNKKSSSPVRDAED
jgi:hypothetical protein